MAVGTPTYGGGPVCVSTYTPLSFASSDDLSSAGDGLGLGVANIQVDVNGQPRQTLQGSTGGLSLNDPNGPLTLSYWAADAVGNVESTHTVSMFVDTAVPVSQLHISTPISLDVAGSTWVTTATSFSLTAADAGCGLASILVSTDTNASFKYSQAFSLTPGTHTITYQGVDVMGLLEAPRTQTVFVDTAAPFLALSVSTPSFTSAATTTTYVTSASLFTLSAADYDDGLLDSRYDIDGSTSFTRGGSTQTFALSGADGPHAIGYEAQDNLRNRTGLRVSTFTLDNTPPLTKISESTPIYFAVDGSTWITSASQITLLSTDALSGVDHIDVSTNGVSTFTYSGAFTLAEGAYTIAYRGVDKVGNAEPFHNQLVKVDDTPPALTYSFSTAPVAGQAAVPVTLPPGNSPWFGAPFYIVWAATDPASGVASVDTPTFVSQEGGGLSFTGHAADNVGNAISTTVVVNLDTAPPVVTLSASTSNFEGSPVVFASSVTDTTDPAPVFSWTFGDGASTGEAAGPSHTYVDNGTYTVTLTATDHAAHTTVSTITVIVANVPPAVASLPNVTLNEGDLFASTAAFADPGLIDTHTATVAWGDGTISSGAALGLTDSYGSGTGSAAMSHVFAHFGIYVATVTVVDKDGGVGTSTFTFIVANAAPVANAGSSLSGLEGSIVSLASASFHDQGTLDTHTARVDWGDGSPADSATVTEAPFGPPGSTSGANGSVADSHVYAHFGAYTITLTVTDDGGRTGTSTTTVAVANVAPTVTAPSPLNSGDLSGIGGWLPLGGQLPVRTLQVYLEGQTSTTTVFIGPSLPIFVLPAAFHDQGTGDTHSATIAWGDGTTSSGSGVTVAESPTAAGVAGSTAGANGTVAAAGDHQYAKSGVYVATVTVTDDGNLSGQAFISVTVDTAAPVTSLGANGPSGSYSTLPGRPGGVALFVSSSAMERLLAVDPVVLGISTGVQNTFFRDDTFAPGAFYTEYNAPFALSQPGLHLLEFFNVDDYGNEEGAGAPPSHPARLIAVDTAAPSSSLAIGQPQQTSFGQTQITPATPLTLSATDFAYGVAQTTPVASGVRAITYTVDGGAPIVVASTSVTLTLPIGTHTVAWWSEDNVGNVEAPHSASFAVWTFGQDVISSLSTIQISGSGAVGVTGQSNGSIQANGAVSLSGNASVYGTATGTPITTSGNAAVHGTETNASAGLPPLPIDPAPLLAQYQSNNNNASIPSGDLKNGVLQVSGKNTLTLTTGVYVLNGLTLSGGAALKTNGPVQLLITGPITISGGSYLNQTGPAANLFIIEAATTTVTFSGGATGVLELYAPHASLDITGNATLGLTSYVKSALVSGNGNALATGDGLPGSGSGGTASADHPSTGPDSTFKLGSVFCFPNPAKPPYKPTLHVETGVADEVKVDVYDVSGGLVKQLTLGAANLGIVGGKYAYEQQWDTSGVGSGVYIYAVTSKKSGASDLKTLGKCAVVK